MSHPVTAPVNAQAVESGDTVSSMVMDKVGEVSNSVGKVTRVVAMSICASLSDLSAGSAARATWKPVEGKCVQMFGLDSHNELGIENGSAVNALKTATVQSARLLESHSTFPIALGVNVSCLPKHEIVETGERYVYCALPQSRINIPQDLFRSDTGIQEGQAWRSKHKEYNASNLETHGVMDTKLNSHVFVKLDHPIMDVLRTNTDIMGVDVDEIPVFDKEWKKISRSVLQRCSAALRTHILNKISTHDLTNFQVNIERVGGQDWLDFEDLTVVRAKMSNFSMASTEAGVGSEAGDASEGMVSEAEIHRFMTTPYEYHARTGIKLTYEVEH